MGVVVTGLRELTDAISRLPEAVTSALKQVANETAHRIAAEAKSNLNAKTHGTGKLARSIHVIERPAEKRFTVDVPGGEGEDPKLGFYVERGTEKMAARPFLRPARDANEARYRRDMAAAAAKAFSQTVK